MHDSSIAQKEIVLMAFFLQFILQQYDNPLSKKLNDIVNEIRRQRCSYLRYKLVLVIRCTSWCYILFSNIFNNFLSLYCFAACVYAKRGIQQVSSSQIHQKTWLSFTTWASSHLSSFKDPKNLWEWKWIWNCWKIRGVEKT